jgi:hypothetical protein
VSHPLRPDEVRETNLGCYTDGKSRAFVKVEHHAVAEVPT